MTDDKKIKPTKNRETTLLIIVALFGLTGLLALLLSRREPAARAAEKSLVQAENQDNSADAQASMRIQKIPGELLRSSEYPEAGQPFRFYMLKYSQGPVYELDFGDGSPRKTFVNGSVQHTFRKSGPCLVTLYARYEGEEVLLDTLRHRVVSNKKLDDDLAPIIDLD
jgi:hypothetical protein